MSDPKEELICNLGLIKDSKSKSKNKDKDNCDVEYFNKQGEKIIVNKNGNNNQKIAKDKMLNHNEENDKINSKKDQRSDDNTIKNNDYEENYDQN